MNAPEINGFNTVAWVEGNVVNNVDPSGKCVPKQICLTNVIDPCECFENCFPPATADEKLFYGCNDGTSTPTPAWQCTGADCQQWLESAYNILLRGNGQVLPMLASLLDELGHHRTIPTAFHFNLPPGSGAITYSGLLIGLDSGYLASNPPTNSQIAILMHELWHTQQGLNDRITIWGEVDAYNLETAVMRAFGMPVPTWRVSLEQYGTPGAVTRDLCDMCQARQCLLSVTNNHWLYSAEPVVNAPGPGSLGGITFAYLPADCPQFCPDTVPASCT